MAMKRIKGKTTVVGLRRLIAFLTLGGLFYTGSIISPGIGCYAQGEGKVQSIPIDFISESGCPITPAESSAQLELDPFNAPVAIRIFITYQNNAQKNLTAAKFRFRFSDASGKDLGTFQASDKKGASPGQTGSEKWRKEGMDPHTTQLKARVLAVKFEDGTEWTSEKYAEYTPATTDGSAGNSAPPAQSAPSTMPNQPAEGFSSDDAGAPPLKPPADDQQIRLHQQ
jgi:hypothetical protein